LECANGDIEVIHRAVRHSKDSLCHVWTLVWIGGIVLLVGRTAPEEKERKMSTREEAREEALKLFDAGIPNEIQDSFYKSMLNGHRWGWHQTSFLLCPACERKVGA